MKTATISLTRKFGDVVIFYLLKICHKNLALFHYVSETVDGRRDAKRDSRTNVEATACGGSERRSIAGRAVLVIERLRLCDGGRGGRLRTNVPDRGCGRHGTVDAHRKHCWWGYLKKKKMYFFIITLWYSLKYLYYMNYTVYYQHCPICNGK